MKNCLSMILFFTIFGISLVSPQAFAEQTKGSSFTPKQQKEIKQLVREYLLNNPRILIEVSDKLQREREQAMQEKAQKAVRIHAKQLFTDPQSPVLGDPKGTINVVEFYDYQCKYCKIIHPTMKKIMKHNPNLRIIHKPVAFFGPTSEYAALAALAAQNQGKYQQLHDRLMQAKRLNKAKINQIAEQLGLNMKKLKEDIEKIRKAQVINKDMMLANQVGVVATPALIIAKYIPGKTNTKTLDSYFVLGAVGQDQIQQVINRVKS